MICAIRRTSGYETPGQWCGVPCNPSHKGGNAAGHRAGAMHRWQQYWLFKSMDVRELPSGYNSRFEFIQDSREILFAPHRLLRFFFVESISTGFSRNFIFVGVDVTSLSFLVITFDLGGVWGCTDCTVPTSSYIKSYDQKSESTSTRAKKNRRSRYQLEQKKS